MRAWTLLVLLGISACSSDSGPTKVAGGGAVLSAVSYDQQWVASLVGAVRQPSGSFIGNLEVSPATGGTPQMIDTQATAASFVRGTTLYYLAGATQVLEGAPVRPHNYGAPKAWFPTLTAPITLGAIASTSVISQDGSTVAFVDLASASETATGTLKVWSRQMCTGTTCPAPITVVNGVEPSHYDVRVSNDGKLVLVGVSKGGTLPAQVILVSLPAGTMQTLSAAAAARSIEMNPEGTTVAWVEGANTIQVAATTSPTAPTPILVKTATAATPVVESIAMVDPQTFVAKDRDTVAGDPSFDLVTATTVTHLTTTKPLRYNIVQETPSGLPASKRWLFFTTTAAANGDDDQWLLDLQTPGAQPVQLASQAAATVAAFSDDGTTIRFFDQFDASINTGDAYVMTLPAGAKTLVATGVRQATFQPGSTRLVYVATPDPTTGVGTLTTFPADAAAVRPGIVNFGQSRTTPDFYYTQELGQPSDGVYRTSEPQ